MTKMSRISFAREVKRLKGNKRIRFGDDKARVNSVHGRVGRVSQRGKQDKSNLGKRKVYQSRNKGEKTLSSIFENVPKIFNYMPRQYGAAITLTLRYIVCHGRVLDPPGA